MQRRVARRTPRVVRDLVRPVWRVLDQRVFDRAAHPAAEKPAGSFPAVPIDGPIRPMTRAEFDGLVAGNPYYVGRDRYFGAAAWLAAGLIERHGLRTALELGPNIRPLIVGADVMDRVERPGLESTAKVILHDATSTPWPMADDAYDLFVALQVFEHLGRSQPVAFAEVRRVARHAIISLPIDWEMEKRSNPHHGITHERALSWFAPTRPTRVVLGNPGYRQRLIYVFEDLD